MIADFDRYLKNTTIYEYNDWDITIKNTYYKDSIWIKYIWHQSFLEFIDKVVEDYNIDIEDDPEIHISSVISKKLRYIFLFIIDTYWKKKSKNEYTKIEEDELRNIFRNLLDFLEKTLFGKIYEDADWKKISTPNYTYTDAKNFYNTIGDNTIADFFKWNKDINKIRQTRNKFIEHIKETEITKGNDFRRIVNSRFGADNTLGRVHIEFFIINENKKYNISLVPLFDFCVFLNWILKTI